MKAESNIKPKALSIERIDNDLAEIIFCENIKETQRDEGIAFTYEEYRTVVPFRDNLLEAVENAKDAWLEKIKNDEVQQINTAKIEQLKAELTATDYKIIKCSECQLTGQALPYDIAVLHAERQTIRNEINQLGG